MGKIKKSNELFAVIGIGIQFPKAKNKDEFWENIKQGRNCITKIPKSRWDYKDYVDDETEEYSQYGSFLEDLEWFNPLLFGISPRDSILMDPQLRKLMEVTLTAFDDAGYTKEKMRNTGVFIGNIHCEYSKLAENKKTEGIINMTAQYDLANKLSNVFDFTGPSVVVDTACSSSLTAIHYAMNSLRNEECRCALVGGANLQLRPERFIGLKEVGILGNREYCAPFGEENGFVLGEGVGVILLKKLEDAEKDNDYIYGVIRNSVCRHMGGKQAFGDVDVDVLKEITEETISRSGIAKETIQLIETGANGVSALDALEFNCINEVFKKSDIPKQSIAVSSVKSNYGNVEAASGIAQVVKVCMELKEHVLAPSIHVSKVHEDISQDGPLRVQTELEEWKETDSNNPRRAFISTIGAGGNVVQLICEEYQTENPGQEETVNGTRRYICPISAPDEISLKKTVEELRNDLECKEISIEDLAYTLQCGRERYRSRIAFTAKDKDECLEKLNAFLEEKETEVFVNKLRASQVETPFSKKDAEALIEEGKESELAKKWTEGYLIEWEVFHDLFGGKRVPFSGVQVKKKKYWLEELTENEYDILQAETVEEFVILVFSEILKMNPEEVELEQNLKGYGLDSLTSIRAINKINELLEIEIQTSKIMDMENIHDIIEYLNTEHSIYDQDIKDICRKDEEMPQDENVSVDVREAIQDILFKKVISGEISAEKVSEIDELLFS